MKQSRLNQPEVKRKTEQNVDALHYWDDTSFEIITTNVLRLYQT
jgi:hypothetical protein